MMKFGDLLSLSDLEIAKLFPPKEVVYSPINQFGVRLFIKRDELLDTHVSGNKVYKLLGHLRRAKLESKSTLLSFGGYYSNHLHALAAAGHELKFNTVGIIRGHRPEKLTPTLADCVRWGMTLRFVSRQEFADYRVRAWQIDSDDEFAQAYVVPEGGGGLDGVDGCRALMKAVSTWLNDVNIEGPTCVCVPCGTGTTLAGLIAGATESASLLGFSALKANPNKPPLSDDVESLLLSANLGGSSQADWRITDAFHCGGFAKTSNELIDFMGDFESQTGILLDPVYTGKMLYGISQLAYQGYWPEGQNIVAVHTGGLQGRRGVTLVTDR